MLSRSFCSLLAHMHIPLFFLLLLVIYYHYYIQRYVHLTALGLINVNKFVKNNKSETSNDLEQQALPNTSHPSNPAIVTVRVTELALKR